MLCNCSAVLTVLLLLLQGVIIAKPSMQRWHSSILLLCLVSLTIRTATCQEAEAAAAEPSAALDPAVAADLLPAEHLPTDAAAAGAAAALMPLSEAAKAQLVDSMMAGVQAGKDEVRQALANPAAAFEQYTAQWASGAFKVASVPAPGSAADKKTLAQRQRIFLSNLKVGPRGQLQASPAACQGCQCSCLLELSGGSCSSSALRTHCVVRLADGCLAVDTAGIASGRAQPSNGSGVQVPGCSRGTESVRTCAIHCLCACRGTTG